MSPAEIAELLKFAGGYGVPKATQADIDAWHHALYRLDYDEAIAAVVVHYRESTADVMPADIWSRCRRPEPPPEPAPRVNPRRRDDPERWHRMWTAALAEAEDACERRRALVLGQPEIAARLRLVPLDFAHRDQWNGYIPPEVFNGEHNDSPRRNALLAILDDAETARLAEAAKAAAKAAAGAGAA